MHIEKCPLSKESYSSKLPGTKGVLQQISTFKMWFCTKELTKCSPIEEWRSELSFHSRELLRFYVEYPLNLTEKYLSGISTLFRSETPTKLTFRTWECTEAVCLAHCGKWGGFKLLLWRHVSLCERICLHHLEEKETAQLNPWHTL